VFNVSVSLIIVFESVALSGVSSFIHKDNPINMAIITSRSDFERIDPYLPEGCKYSLRTNLSSRIERLC
jgi:hypothetical protein